MMNSQQAINLLNGLEQRLDDYCELNNEGKAAFRMAITALELFGNAEQLPSAQPERTCVNCGRTANNGGWYADGRTRCPIEEHYALPKDGYCHLWEKRNVTDDDYPERRGMTFKIGDRVFVHGYIDEIRKDTVIIRNTGGYFGTILSEVTGELPSAQETHEERTERMEGDL